jgi:hypothetical protein
MSNKNNDYTDNDNDNDNNNNKNIDNLNGLNSSFDNLLIFSEEYNKINELSSILDNLFLSNDLFVIKSNNIEFNNIHQIIFNNIYNKELERGNIEYKRTLESYNHNNKTKKLIRQIHWRIYEGVVNIDKECCYYIIGIEDSGHPSFLTQTELFNSLHFMLKCIENTEITYSFLFVKNSILNYDYIIVKFWPLELNFIDYF